MLFWPRWPRILQKPSIITCGRLFQLSSALYACQGCIWAYEIYLIFSNPFIYSPQSAPSLIAMSTSFVTKRPHKKSRAGCKTMESQSPFHCFEAVASYTDSSFSVMRSNHRVLFAQQEKLNASIHLGQYHQRMHRKISWRREASDESISPPGSVSPINIEHRSFYPSIELVNCMPAILTSSGDLSANDM